MQAAQHGSLHQHAQGRCQQRHDQQRPPVVQAQVLHQPPGDEGAQHVLRAVGKVDDVQQAKNDGQPQAQQRVKRAIDQADQQLTDDGGGWDVQHIHRDATSNAEQRFDALAVSLKLGAAQVQRHTAFVNHVEAVAQA